MFLVCKLLLCAGLEKRRVEYNRLQGPPTWRLGKGAKDPAWPGARRPGPSARQSDNALTARPLARPGNRGTEGHDRVGLCAEACREQGVRSAGDGYLWRTEWTAVR